MSNDPAAMLAIFLSIDPKVIARDQLDARNQLKTVVEAISSLRAIHYKNRTSEIEAKIAHCMMIQAYELTQMQDVEPEFKVFYVAFGAGEIVQNAETVALNKGKLAELDVRMTEIRKREGLSEDEFCYRTQGPPDHQALEEEWDEIADRVTDTILIHVLRRYSLSEYADLYENKRMQFEILRETGSRVLMGKTEMLSEVTELMDRHIVKKYGEQALRAIRRRANELRRLRG